MATRRLVPAPVFTLHNASLLTSAARSLFQPSLTICIHNEGRQKARVTYPILLQRPQQHYPDLQSACQPVPNGPHCRHRLQYSDSTTHPSLQGMRQLAPLPVRSYPRHPRGLLAQTTLHSAISPYHLDTVTSGLIIWLRQRSWPLPHPKLGNAQETVLRKAQIPFPTELDSMSFIPTSSSQHTDSAHSPAPIPYGMRVLSSLPKSAFSPNPFSRVVGGPAGQLLEDQFQLIISREQLIF